MRERQGECAAELAIANVGSATGQPDTAWTWEQSDERGRRLQDQCSQLRTSGSMVFRGSRAEITPWSRQANCITPCALRNALRDRPGAGTACALSGAPQPFHLTTTMRLSLAQPAAVRIEVGDVSGRHVCVLTAGGVPVRWDEWAAREPAQQGLEWPSDSGPDCR